MTDLPAAQTEGHDPERSLWGRLASGRARALFVAAYAVAFLITAAAIWLVAIAPGAMAGGDARTSASRAVLYILLANLILIGGLAAVIGGRVLRLTRNRNDPGARRFRGWHAADNAAPAPEADHAHAR